MIKRILCGLLALATVLPVAGVTLAIDSVEATQGSQVTVPVRVMDFQQMISMQGSLSWDTAVAAFVAVDSFGLVGMNTGSFGTTQSANGTLSFSWDDSSLQGVDLADSTVVFTLDFMMKGIPGTQTTIVCIDIPSVREFVDTSLSPIAYSLQDGLIANPDTNVGTGNLSPTLTQPFFLYPHPVSSAGSRMLIPAEWAHTCSGVLLRNLQGQVVREWTPSQGFRLEQWEWNGTDADGKMLPDGTYLLHLVFPETYQTIKITLKKRP